MKTKTGKYKSISYTKNLVVLLCLAGFIYQFYSVTDVYLMYDVVFELRIVKPKIIAMPDISYCVSIEGAVNLTRIYSDDKLTKFIAVITSEERYQMFSVLDTEKFKSKKYIFQGFLSEIFKNLTANKWKDYIYDQNLVIKVLDISSPNLTGRIRPDITPKASFKSPNTICYTLAFQKGINYSYSNINLRASFSGSMANIFINVPLTSLGLSKEILFHMQGTQPRGTPQPYFIKDNDKYNGYDLVFKRYITSLLPDPYITRCLNYPELGFASRNHAVDDCTYKLSVEQTGALCCHTVISLNDHILNMNFTTYSVKTDETVEANILDYCEKKFSRPDCLKMRHLPRERKSFVFDRIDGYRFIIYVPLEYDFVTKTYPKMLLLDYIICIGSIIAFWFGLSLLEIGTRGHTYVHNFMNRFKIGSVNSVQFTQNITIHASRQCGKNLKQPKLMMYYR